MPNAYLHDIAKDGTRYRDSGAASLACSVTLFQSRPFRMLSVGQNSATITAIMAV